MNNINKIAVLGGDQRQCAAAKELGKRFSSVFAWGIYDSLGTTDNIVYCEDYKEAVSGASAVILPLPVSTDGIRLNCPFYGDDIKPSLTDILNCIEPCSLVIGGKIPAVFLENAGKRGIGVRDYLELEEFQIRNAYITAEAALSIAMNSLDINLMGANVAITGYGRIAKHLIRLLRAMDVNVTVAARKESDLAWCYSLGCNIIKIGDSPELRDNIYKLIKGYDIIYNTVPSWLFGRSFLENIRSIWFSCFFINFKLIIVFVF